MALDELGRAGKNRNMRGRIWLTVVVASATAAWAAPTQRAAIEARLAALELGPHAETVRALVRRAGAVRPESLEVVHGQDGMTLLAWDRTPRRHDTRTAWLIAAEGTLDVSGDLAPIEVARDGRDARPVRAPGALALEGDGRSGLGVVRAGDVDVLVYGIRDGQLLRASGTFRRTTLRATACGPALVEPGAVHLWDLATLRRPGRHPCRDALANLLRAAVEADPVVRDAERQLETLAPDRHDKAPGAPPARPCERASAAEQTAARALLEALPPPPGGTKAPKLHIAAEDFGCKAPGTGAYLVRVLGLGDRARRDAVVSVTQGRARLAAGWEATPSEIHAFLEVDLDGDGAVETAVMRGFSDPRRGRWEIFRADGTLLTTLADLSRYPRLRPVRAPAGDGLLAGTELLRWDGRALAKAPAGFAEVRAALQAVAAAKTTLAAHEEAMRQALWAELPAGGRAAWEQTIRARFEALGGWSERLEKLLAAARAPER